MAVSYLSQNADSSSGGVTDSLTVSVTPSGNNRLLIASTGSGDSPAVDISSVVFNTTETFTEHADTGNFQNYYTHQLAYRYNPTATTANVVATWASTPDEVALGVAVFSGVDDTTPLDTAEVVTGSGSNFSDTVTSETGDMAYQSFLSTDTSITVAQGSTQIFNEVTSWWSFAGCYEAGAASVTLGWTNGSGPYGGITVNINAAADAAKTASGTPTLGSPTASGSVQTILGASGTPSLSQATASGSVQITGQVTASGTPEVTEVTASGTVETTGPVLASGTATSDQATAAGNSYRTTVDITSVSGDDVYDDGSSSIPIVGTNFVIARKALRFPSNINGNDSTAAYAVIELLNPELDGLPMFGPSGAGVTVMRRIRFRQHQGYISAIWHSGDTWNPASNGGWGFHPFPQNGTSTGNTHYHSIAPGDGGDYIDYQGNNYGSGSPTAVTYNQWYTQACRVVRDGPSDKTYTSYFDLANGMGTSYYIEKNIIISNFYEFTPSNPSVTIGDAPWSNPEAAGAPHECLSGDIAEILIFNRALTDQEISDQYNNGLTSLHSSVAANIWWGKRGFTGVDDLTCDFGTGRSFSRNDSGNLLSVVSK